LIHPPVLEKQFIVLLALVLLPLVLLELVKFCLLVVEVLAELATAAAAAQVVMSTTLQQLFPLER
jgi:hypothetical protein